MGKIRFKDYLTDYLEINNITNKDFANRIGISEKHLIDILSGNADISTNLIERISIVTSIPSDYIFRIESNYKFEKDINDYFKENNINKIDFLNKFKYKYLIKEKYIDITDNGDKFEVIKDILKFLRVPKPEKIYEIDMNAYYKSKNDKPELLLLWLEKCYRQTLKQEINDYSKDNINNLVNYINECAKDCIFNEKDLIKKFNENGIYLVIQEDIPGSKIRGAFRVHRGKPAIYLTYKHKRIADIYFSLLHELAHCKTDFNKAQAQSLISYEDKVDDIEYKADKQAYNWMIDKNYYNKECLSPFYDIYNDNNYPKCFIVYRLAKDGRIKYDSKEYQKYNSLLK